MKGDTTDMATTSSNGSNYDGDGGDGTMMMTSITMTMMMASSIMMTMMMTLTLTMTMARMSMMRLMTLMDLFEQNNICTSWKNEILAIHNPFACLVHCYPFQTRLLTSIICKHCFSVKV
jgi:hypothetical protein